jgi:hypothetical protein
MFAPEYRNGNALWQLHFHIDTSKTDLNYDQAKILVFQVLVVTPA